MWGLPLSWPRELIIPDTWITVSTRGLTFKIEILVTILETLGPRVAAVL